MRCVCIDVFKFKQQRFIRHFTGLLDRDDTADVSAVLGIACAWKLMTRASCPHRPVTRPHPVHCVLCRPGRTIILSNNQLSGPVPSSLFASTSLVTVDAANNALDGTLPTVMSSSSLKSVQLANNRLVGPITSRYYGVLCSLTYAPWWDLLPGCRDTAQSFVLCLIDSSVECWSTVCMTHDVVQ